MAAKQKKNQKFGRHLKSPAAQQYKASNREAINKEKKVKKHVKNNPNDLRAKSVLKSNGGYGSAVEFPVKPVDRPKKMHTPDLVPEDFTKADQVFILESECGVTIDVATREKDLVMVAKSGKYHLPMRLYEVTRDGKLLLKQAFKGSTVPVSRKDLLTALKNGGSHV